MRERLQSDIYVEGILSGNQLLLSRAITLAESTLEEDRILSGDILRKVLPHAGKALRIGITGIPGVGKSTFIDAFGQNLTENGMRVAVLAVDPTSKKSGGSILGDKTRMERLSGNPNAFIRPSPAGLSAGGVTQGTRAAILLCEAAGYDVILVETVGVGQSEVMVRNITDFFLLLVMPGAGDELQGIKRGIMEMCDAVVVNKADGEGKKAAMLAAREYQSALHYMHVRDSGLPVNVFTCSAAQNAGLEDIWQNVEDHISKTRANGFFEQNRKSQNVGSLHDQLQHLLLDAFYGNKELSSEIARLENDVREGKALPEQAAGQLISHFLRLNQNGS